jgi:hypothetical protein
MIAAVLGFLGSILILWASWRTVRLRKAILEAIHLNTDDPHIREGAAVLLGKLDQQQLDTLHDEQRLYQWGAGLLALGFVLTFFRELF